jgi:hypothetical protein
MLTFLEALEAVAGGTARTWTVAVLPVMVDAQGYLDLDFGVPVPEIPSIHPRKALNYPSGVLARWNFIVMTGKGKADQIRRDLMCELRAAVRIP